jgi:hypothetical protein
MVVERIMLEAIADTDVPSIVSLMNRAYRGSGASAGWNSEVAYIGCDRITENLLRADLLAKPEARFSSGSILSPADYSDACGLRDLI